MDKAKNTPKYKIVNQYFSGGNSIDPKLAVANSFFASQNLDFRTTPSQMTVLPQSRQVTGNLTDLITAMDQDQTGVRWGVGNKGSLYKLSTSNVVTKVAQLSENGSAGLYYNQVSDTLYIPGQTAMSIYGKLSNNPVFTDKNFDFSASQADGCVLVYNPDTNYFDGNAGVRNNAQSINQVGITNSSQVTSNCTAAYTLPTSISEIYGNYCFFAPDIEPFHSIDVYISNKGTGNWTLTLHDSSNNTLATVTVTNANLKSNAYNKFKFSGPIRALVSASQTGSSATYHFHLTSSVNSDTATAAVYSANDLTGCDFLLYAYRLVSTNNGWHPTAMFIVNNVASLCIGNGQYLSTYNFGNDANPTNTQWVRHALYFKPGFEVCGMTTNNQYLVIAAEKRSTNASRNAQAGVLYFWDGTTTYPNFTIEIPNGSPYGLYTFNNVTYFTVAGSLYAWSGGQTVIKVRKMAYQNTDYLNAVDSTIVNPNMTTSRYNLLMLGYPSSSTNVNLGYGIKSWGTVELTFPNSFGDSYQQSHGYYYNNTAGITNLQLGCVYNFVDSMYSTWSYTLGGTTYYGIDVVDNFSLPATNFSWQSLIYDGGVRYKAKKGLRLKINFLPLPAGVTLTAQYNLDRSGWVSSDPASGNSYTAATGDTSVLVEFDNMRFFEFQYGFFGTISGSTAPVITSIAFEVDPLVDEGVIRKDYS